jgi:hypothetical protein
MKIGRKFRENFRGNFRNYENSGKRSSENSRKTPGKLGVFFDVNAMFQSENLYFYFYKSAENRRKLHGKF